jgi:hypothetical protein
LEISKMNWVIFYKGLLMRPCEWSSGGTLPTARGKVVTEEWTT